MKLARPSASLFPLLSVLGLVLAACEGELNPSTAGELVSDEATATPLPWWNTTSTGSASDVVYGITGTAPDALYLCGARGGLWYWDGLTFYDISPFTDRETAPDLLGLWLHQRDTTSTLFVVGQHGTLLIGQAIGRPLDASDLETSPVSTASHFQDVFGFATDDVWAVGDGGVYHFDGETWQRDGSSPGQSYLRGIWGRSASDLYAVGTTSEGQSPLYHRDQAGWSAVSVDFSDDLHDVWGQAEDVWAVGQAGAVLRLQEGTWTQQEVGTFEHLWGVTGSEQTVTVVGTNGEVLRWEAETWTAVETELTGPLYTAWQGSADSLFAAGDHGVWLEWLPEGSEE